MLRKAFQILVMCLMSALCASAQGTRRDGLAISTFGPYLRPIPGGAVRVCQQNSTGTPCTPLQSIYSDIALMVPKANPFLVDADGGYTYYTTTGAIVDEVLSGSGVVTEKFSNISIGNIATGTVSSVSVGNLAPIFTASVANPTAAAAVTFALTNAAQYTVFGRCTGGTGAPSYCAIVNAMMPAPGSTKSLIFNASNLFASSTDLTWDDTTKTLAVKTSGTSGITLIAGSGGKVVWGGDVPFIRNVTDWEFTTDSSSDIRFGVSGGETALFKICTTSASCGVAGKVQLGIASFEGILQLNDGTSAAGTFVGPLIMAGNATPESNFAGRVGSIYMRADGAAGTNVYTKETGTGNTGWSSLSVLLGPTGTGLPNAHRVIGSCTLGSDCAITLTNAAVYTSSTSYTCSAEDQTAAAATKIVQASGTAFTITGTGTDALRFFCDGN